MKTFLLFMGGEVVYKENWSFIFTPFFPLGCIRKPMRKTLEPNLWFNKTEPPQPSTDLLHMVEEPLDTDTK